MNPSDRRPPFPLRAEANPGRVRAGERDQILGDFVRHTEIPDHRGRQVRGVVVR